MKKVLCFLVFPFFGMMPVFSQEAVLSTQVFIEAAYIGDTNTNRASVIHCIWRDIR